MSKSKSNEEEALESTDLLARFNEVEKLLKDLNDEKKQLTKEKQHLMRKLLMTKKSKVEKGRRDRIARHERIKKLNSDGEKYSVIAKKVDMSISGVKSYLRSRGLL